MEPIFALTLTADWSPKVGDLIENFGQIARVLEVRPHPYNDLLVSEVVNTRKGQTWYADPAKCRPVR